MTDDNAGLLTVRFTVPETLFSVAVTVTEPTFNAVTRPALLTDAMAVFELDQITCELTSAVLLSLKVPCAISCCVCPTAIEKVAGTIAIEDSVAGETVTDMLPDIEPEVAVIVTVPALIAVSIPVELTVATLLSDVDHVAVVVMKPVVWSE